MTDDLTPEQIEQINAEVMCLETPYGMWVTAEDYAALLARAEVAEAALAEASAAWEAFKGATITTDHHDAVDRLDRALTPPQEDQP
jgi:hypothetical protein